MAFLVLGSSRESLSLALLTVVFCEPDTANYFETKTSSFMAVNTFRRYIWLIDYLDRRGYATYEDICNAWFRSSVNEEGEELPKRTFRNHITAIQEQFGIQIAFRKGRGYTIDQDDMNESKTAKWMLSSLSMYNTLSECQGMKERILFDDVPARDGLQDLVQAMKNGNVVSFMYRSHFESDYHYVEMEPYCMKFFKQRWYVLGRRTEDGGLRTYALERMTDIDQTDGTFTIPDDFDGEAYFRNYFGVTASGDPERIVLKAMNSEVRYIRALPLHHSQREIEKGEDYSVFELALAPTWDFKQELLSRADQIEVLEPASLRQWMKDTAGKILSKY